MKLACLPMVYRVFALHTLSQKTCFRRDQSMEMQLMTESIQLEQPLGMCQSQAVVEGEIICQ